MSAIIYWQNPCKLPMSFRCVKAFMHASSSRFSRASLEGISFNFFVCFILNVSIGSAPKRKNIDIQRNPRVGLGCQFTSNLLLCHHMWLFLISCPKNGVFFIAVTFIHMWLFLISKQNTSCNIFEKVLPESAIRDFMISNWHQPSASRGRPWPLPVLRPW